MSDLKLENSMKFDGRDFTLEIDLRDDNGVIMGSTIVKISAVALVKKLIQATPTKLDDMLLPYVDALANLIPKKGSDEAPPAAE